jgi:hypothetical protein
LKRLEKSSLRKEQQQNSRTTNFRIFSHSGHEKVSIFLSKQFLERVFKFLKLHLDILAKRWRKKLRVF